MVGRWAALVVVGLLSLEAAAEEPGAWRVKVDETKVETIRGRVTARSQPTGTLLVRQEDDVRVVIHGRPEEIAAFEEGQVVAVQVSVHQGQRWLLPPQEEEDPPRRRGRVKEARGEVRHLDVGRGLVTLQEGKRRTLFQAHPSVLAQLQPGQQVSLSFRALDYQNWIEELRTAPTTSADAAPSP